MTDDPHPPTKGDEPQPADGNGPIRPELGVFRVVLIYGVMALIGWGMALWSLGRGPLLASEASEVVPLWHAVALGAGLGLVVALLDLLLERWIPAVRQMGEAFYELLGVMTPGRALVFAASSAVGEEIVFRGWLLPWSADMAAWLATLVAPEWTFEGWSWVGIGVSSVLFGAMHIPPDRRLWVWPLLAALMGVLFGWMFVSTGSLLAPILAHFTINYFGFMRLASRWAGEARVDPPG
ncbi:MAG: CPBP family intramembrane glutamic endopeptidase [Myxococcota bacterium]